MMSSLLKGHENDKKNSHKNVLSQKNDRKKNHQQSFGRNTKSSQKENIWLGEKRGNL